MCMKKTILSLLLIGSSCAIFAQTTQTGNNTTTNQNNNTNTTTNSNGTNGTTGTNGTDMNNTMNSTNVYNAYGTSSANVPPSVQMYLLRDYPAASNVMWQQNGDWYGAAYNTGNRYSHVYYNQAGASYT